MRGNGWILAAMAAAFVTACATPDDEFGSPGDGYIADTPEIANAADWARAERVVVELAEYSFSPETLRFREGQPYALMLMNSGAKPHRFVASEFFRAIAAKSLVYADAETSFPPLEAIALEAREAKTLYFVPVLPGDYEVTCDRPFHATLGMFGRILIE